KIGHQLIVGPQQSPLKKTHANTLKLPLFANGYEALPIDNNPYLSNLFKPDLTIYRHCQLPYQRQQSVFSIHKNIDQGAQLISKMKLFIGNKQRILQKLIESDTNNACAAVFPVYIKHYRCIDLAQHELAQPIDQKGRGCG
ncbi:unnamed protein product, partial [Rotaria sp. Silwood1]